VTLPCLSMFPPGVSVGADGSSPVYTIRTQNAVLFWLARRAGYPLGAGLSRIPKDRGATYIATSKAQVLVCCKEKWTAPLIIHRGRVARGRKIQAGTNGPEIPR
jgi:hypothetical protein